MTMAVGTLGSMLLLSGPCWHARPLFSFALLLLLCVFFRELCEWLPDALIFLT